MTTTARLLWVALIVVACVAADQVTKVIAHRELAGAEPILLLDGVLRLQYAENTGAFLSLGSGLPPALRTGLFIVVTGVVLAGLAVYGIRAPDLHRAEVLALALVVGGGIGNLIDRIALGIVRDFLFMGMGRLRTGVFNVADVAITTGAVVMVAHLALGRLRRRGQVGASTSS